jgi:AcrR family transcriptional regulator
LFPYATVWHVETENGKSVTSAARLTKADWIGAAINAVEHGGIAGIAVESIATALGTTKGSFYWHFANRDELIAAVMKQWEELATNMVIASVAEVPDPMDRLRQLLQVVFGNERGDRIEARIVLAPFDERVNPTVERVTALRLEFLVSLFRGLGFSHSTAAKRSRIAYAAYLGHLRLALDDTPTTSIAARPTPAATRAYAEELLSVLTSPALKP